MESDLIVFLVFLGLALLGLMFKFIQSKRPYFKIKTQLEKELQQVTKTQDWQKKQELNLQLLWLDIIKKSETSFLLNYQKDDNEIESKLSKLTNRELEFPSEFKRNNDNHLLLVKRIIGDSGKLIAENDTKVLFKSESILAYPKEKIKKAIQFQLDIIKDESSLYKPSDRTKFIESLEGVNAVLDLYFIKINEEDLPKTMSENVDVGNKYIETHEN